MVRLVKRYGGGSRKLYDTEESRYVSLDEVAERAVLEIVDHGEGIPPQIREKIFQRFWRADTSRARADLGFHLDPAVVQLHERVAKLPKVAAYLRSERRIAFNEQGIFRCYPELDIQ